MNMKNILKSVFALALLVVMGCDRTEAPVYNGGEFVAFKGNIVTVDESDPSFGITITGTKPGLSSALSFEGTAVLGEDFTVDSQTVTVGDEYTTTLTVTPIDNSVVDGIREVSITLTEGGFPGGAAGKVYTVRFLDNDCPIPSIEGTFSVVTTETSPGGCSGVTNTVIITKKDDNTYTLTDVTGGLYKNCYGAADNLGDIVVSGKNITMTDQPDVVYGGDVFNGSGIINCDGSFTLTWSNGFGDAGTSTFTK